MALTIGPWPGTGDAEPPTATVQPDTTVRAASATTTCHFMRMRRVLPFGPDVTGPNGCAPGITANQRGVRTSLPPTNGRSASGTRTEPSSCWWFSRIATIHRVVARVPLSVAAICGLPFSPR